MTASSTTNGVWLRLRTPLLCAAIFVIQFLHVRHHLWGMADFWAHAAAVRELAARPLHPHHPIFGLSAPDPYLSPYALLLAVFSRLSGRDAETTLAWASFFDLALLLYALRRFTFALFHRREAFFWALLLLQVGWGRNPWGFSGFCRFGNLGYVAAYPSTFALSLTLLAGALALAFVEEARPARVAVIALLATVVVLSHPITSMYLFILLGVIAVDGVRRKRPLAQMALLAGTAPLSLAIATAWPYFPLWRLLLHNADHFNALNRLMYEQVLWRLGPALLGVPVLVIRLRRNRTDPLTLSFVLLLAAYVVGRFGFSSFGRMISFIALTLQLALAGELVALVDDDARTWRTWAIAGAFALLLLFDAFHYRNYFALLRSNATSPTEQFRIATVIPRDDVVIVPPDLAMPMPSYGGKLVSTPATLAFVEDGEQRLAALQTFFDRRTSDDERTRLACNYHARWLAIPPSGATAEMLAPFIAGAATAAARSPALALFRLDRLRCATP